MFILPNDARITSSYGARKHPITGEVGKMHWGTDFGKDGSPNILASADGTVTLARVNGGFGNCVYLEHIIGGKVYNTVYAHLSKINVKLGQKVKQGAVIGIKGMTGNSTGVHLHFELCVGRWNNKYTTNVDPMKYIKKVEEVKLVAVIPKTRFSDVSEKHSAYGALERLSKAGIVNGYEDGTFRPNEPVTRAHMVILLDKALNGKG